jgi:hypothetical protein
MGGFTNASEQQSEPCNHGEVSDLYACNDERTNEQTADNFELVHCNNSIQKKKRGVRLSRQIEKAGGEIEDI